MPKRKSTKQPRGRKLAPQEPHVEATPAAPTRPSWDSPETLASVLEKTASVAGSWGFIAHCTSEPIAHKTASARAMILNAVVDGDAACLRDLAGRAATHLARRDRASESVGFSKIRDADFEGFHHLVMEYLQPKSPPAEHARDAIATQQIARDMIVGARGRPEIGPMLAPYHPELFSLTRVPGPVPDTWIAKLTAALNRVRHARDIDEAAEKMIVQFLLTFGVPEQRARAVWDFRKKRVKRGARVD